MHKLGSAIAALSLSVGMLAGETKAADPQVVDELAFDLMRQTAAAAREVRYGFRRAPQYRHLYQDVYDMYCEAKHIHDVAHLDGNQRHLLKDVEELDVLVHHIEELIDEMSGAGVGHSVDQLGHHVYYRHHVSNRYHLRRLRRLMVGIVDTVHELQDIVGFCRPSGPVLQGPPAAVPNVIPPSPLVVPRSSVGRRGSFDFRRRRPGGLSFSVRIP